MHIPYPTAYLGLSPWDAIVALINQQNHTRYTSSDCTLVGVDPHHQNVVEIHVAVKNHYGVLRMIPPLKQYLIKIERLNVSDYLVGFEPDHPGPFYKTTSDLIKELRRKFPGIYLTDDDFVDEDIPVDAETHTLKASRFSLRWWDELPITFAK